MILYFTLTGLSLSPASDWQVLSSARCKNLYIHIHATTSEEYDITFYFERESGDVCAAYGEINKYGVSFRGDKKYGLRSYFGLPVQETQRAASDIMYGKKKIMPRVFSNTDDITPALLLLYNVYNGGYA